jgi:DNA recombination protein RmuC
MDTALFLLIPIILGFSVVIFLMNKKLSDLKTQQADTTLLEWLKSMQTSLDNTNTTMQQAMRTNSSAVVQTLQENTKQLNQRLDTAASVIRDVGREVGQMSEIGRSMKELQQFLKSPKMRGNIGEEILKDLIGQMFPKNSFHLQYQFKSGEKVDAAIQTDGGILPIDSKFPLENFQRIMAAETDEEKVPFRREFLRDVKKHIDAIAKKYILPAEGTMDFALMYIPSESVYYELCNEVEILDYARRARVYLVSPSTLYAHLQTILLSFEGKKIETKSKEVFKLLRSMRVDYDKIDESLGVLGKHLNNASSQFGQVTTTISQLGRKLESTKLFEEVEETPKLTE